MNRSSLSRLPASILFALVLAAGATALAQARTFTVGGSANRIRFTSEATLETMVGSSSSVSGRFAVDPRDLSSASGELEVPIASLRTGIDLRDEHLRSDAWLDAARYPTARFELVGVSGATALTPGAETRLILRGRFSLHGRTRDVTANARVTWAEEASAPGRATVTVRAHFAIRLTDFGISVPEIVRLKVANDIAIDVRVVANAS